MSYSSNKCCAPLSTVVVLSLRIEEVIVDALERIIRPIVEGQIRGFLAEHPSVAEAVDWYKPRKSKSDTFTNSLSKRIVRDLVCANSKARIKAAVLEVWSEPTQQPSVEPLLRRVGRIWHTSWMRPSRNNL